MKRCQKGTRKNKEGECIKIDNKRASPKNCPKFICKTIDGKCISVENEINKKTSPKEKISKEETSTIIKESNKTINLT